MAVRLSCYELYAIPVTGRPVIQHTHHSDVLSATARICLKFCALIREHSAIHYDRLLSLLMLPFAAPVCHIMRIGREAENGDSRSACDRKHGTFHF
jgi:hypothetical protein